MGSEMVADNNGNYNRHEKLIIGLVAGQEIYKREGIKVRGLSYTLYNKKLKYDEDTVAVAITRVDGACDKLEFSNYERPSNQQDGSWQQSVELNLREENPDHWLTISAN